MAVQKLVMQIVLDPLLHFENHIHQVLLVREGLARKTKVCGDITEM